MIRVLILKKYDPSQREVFLRHHNFTKLDTAPFSQDPIHKSIETTLFEEICECLAKNPNSIKRMTNPDRLGMELSGRLIDINKLIASERFYIYGRIVAGII